MKKVSVIGAGSWGTALASVLADNGYHVWLHSKDDQVAAEITNHHTNTKYLPTTVLPSSLISSSSMEDVLKDAEFVLFVVPSHAMRQVAKQAAPYIPSNALVAHASKGIEIETSKTMSIVLDEELSSHISSPIVVFSGPSHAEEVVLKHPTAIVASCKEIAFAKQVQQLFMNPYLRVYTNTDVVGVELGGSLKNIIALAAGLSDGLGFGDNAKAALLTRGLAEMTRLGMKMGADPLTFSGLTGIGDLIVTGTSKHSRNWRTGNLLAQGKTLDEALDEIGMVAEGVKTTKAAHLISQDLHVELPITNQLYALLFENKDPRQAVRDLMERNQVNEWHHLDS